jgi:hypothetical protein
MPDKLFDAKKLVGEIEVAMSDFNNAKTDKIGFGITFSRLIRCLEESSISFDDSAEHWKQEEIEIIVQRLVKLLGESNLKVCAYC